MIRVPIGEQGSQRSAFPVCICLRTAVFLGITLIATISAIAQNADLDTSQTETIRGTVINSVTHAGIPRALVYSGDNRYAVLTDGDGHFEFAVPKTGADGAASSMYSGALRQFPTIAFMARKPGFLDNPYHPSTVGSSGEDVTISLVPEGIIKGRVITSGNEPAPAVTVQILTRQVEEGLPHWVPGLVTQANSAGEFRFAELLPGSYKVVTREWMDNDPVTAVPGAPQYGYPPVYYPGVADPSAATAIEVGAGQTVQADLQISGQRYYPVRIPLLNANAGNGLNIFVQGQQGAQFELGYNPREQRIDGMLPNGNYVIEATGYGPNSVSGSVVIRVADAPVRGPALALTPNISIPVNVKEEFNDTSWNGSGQWWDGRRSHPLRGPRLYLQVRLESADDHGRGVVAVQPATGQGDETMALQGVAPGRYWLRVFTSRGYVAAAIMGSIDLLHQPFTVAPGSSAPIEITMRDDGAQLEGRISSLGDQTAFSAGVPRAWVYCLPLPDSTGQMQEFAVSGDGSFNAQTMAPGDYRILAFSGPQPNLPYRDPESVKAYESKGQVVHLSAGQKTTVQLQNILTPE